MPSSPLIHDPSAPFQATASRVLAQHGQFKLRSDQVAWPDGMTADYTVVEGPIAVVVVALGIEGETVLVRQWRHPWQQTSWEVPAGTLDTGEEPLAGARRELAEEAGFAASRWTPLGQGRSSAASTSGFHFFLAQELSPVERAPEAYEQDMIALTLPFPEALDRALGGEILHCASVTGLCLAARRLGIL